MEPNNFVVRFVIVCLLVLMVSGCVPKPYCYHGNPYSIGGDTVYDLTVENGVFHYKDANGRMSMSVTGRFTEGVCSW